MPPESFPVTYNFLNEEQVIMLIDSRDLSVQYMNHPVEQFGRKTSQKSYLKDLVHPEDWNTCRACFNSLTNDFSEGLPIRFFGKDENWNTYIFRNRNYKKEKDNLVLCLAVTATPQDKFREDQGEENFWKNEYEHLLDSLDEAFALVEVIFSPEENPVDYFFLKVNNAYEIQANLKEVVGKTVEEVLPNYNKRVLQKIGEVAKTGKSIRIEERSSSLERWFDLYLFKVGKAGSNQVALLFRNITEGKTAEEKLHEELLVNQQSLRQSKELLQTVFDTTNLGIAVLHTIYDKNGSVKDFEFTMVNKVIREMYLRNDVIGHSYLETTKYGVEMGIFDAYLKVMETGEPFDEEFYFTRDGYNNWFRVTARKSQEVLITTIEDITRAKTEAEALKESLRFKKELVETTPEIIMIIDLNTFSVKYINKDLLPEAGITKEKVQSLGLAEVLPFVHPRDREKILDLHKKLLKSSSEQIYDIEVRLKLSGIAWQWFNVRGKVFLRRNENWVDEYVLLVRNISDQKHTQKALLKAEKLSIQGELARTFAHELRNPLASIGMVGEFMNQKISEEQKEELKPYFEILKRSTKTINNLVNNLLNAANYVPAVLEKQNLAQILDQTLDSASDRIYLAGIQVVKNYSGVYNIMADKEKLQIALLNIIVNASEATTPGEGIIEISVETRDSEYILGIKDNGHGMNDTEIEHLFEAFYSNKENGMGVGLSSVKNILEEHDAQIKVESEPEKGTCFKLYFHNADKL